MSRIPLTVTRTVNVEALRALVGEKKDAARRIAANESDVERVRRKLQRAINRGTMEQATAEEIAAGFGVDPESFLEPYEKEDPRLRELRRLGRQADRIRRELDLPPRDFEAELLSQDG